MDDLSDGAKVEALAERRRQKADGFLIARDIIDLIPSLTDDQAARKAVELLIDIARDRNTTLAVPGAVQDALGGENRQELRRLIARMEAVSARSSIHKHPHYGFEYRDIQEFARTYFQKKLPSFIHKDTVIAALGSCFAVNVTRHLQALGYDASVGKMAEHINNSHTNLALMRSFSDAAAFDEIFNRSDLNSTVRESFIEYRQTVLRADVFIYTLGLSYAFYDRTTGEVLSNPVQSYSAATYRNFVMRPIPVSENVRNITEIINIVRSIRPRSTIVFSLSPIPLDGILDYGQSVVEADCLSKSIGRVTLSEIEAQQDSLGGNIVYFPSFEIARWVACNQDIPLFGGEDGWARHLDRRITGAIMNVFTQFYCS